MASVLLCSHDPMLLRGLENPLRDAGHSVTSAAGAAQGVRLVLERAFDVVLFDAGAPGMSVADAVAVVGRVAPGTRAVVRGDVGAGRGVEAVTGGSGLEELRRVILGAVHAETTPSGKERG